MKLEVVWGIGGTAPHVFNVGKRKRETSASRSFCLLTRKSSLVFWEYEDVWAVDAVWAL